MVTRPPPGFFFFFNDTATTEIYTLSLHDTLPISSPGSPRRISMWSTSSSPTGPRMPGRRTDRRSRSEEHTSELQSLTNLVCRLLLEKKQFRAISNVRGMADILLQYLRG